ncbi:MAG: Fe-S cluster assembly protein SufD [Cyclobacteriaceae bacterium]|nr:Fe-S cluster assembly protein SufD [Cyclobacteriaceae bacterium]
MNSTITHKDLTDEVVASFQEATFGEATLNREKAIQFLKKNGLPSTKHEEYRFAPITKSLERNFTWRNEVSPSSIKSIDEFLIPSLDAYVLVFVNGAYSTNLSVVNNLPGGVKVKTLSEAFEHEKEIIDQYFDKLVASEADSFAALNSAFWQEGIFIHVPENISVEKPLLILHINDAHQTQVIAHTRILAVIENNSSLNVIEKFDSIGNNPVFNTLSEEFVVGEHASLEYCKTQNDDRLHQVANTVIHQSNSSQVNTFTLTLQGKVIRNNFNITIDGEHCESHFYGLYLLNGSTLADNHTVVDHRKANSFSNELYKGIMDGNSKGVFNGKIFVRPHAQKTNAFQSNRNIIISDSATVNTKPQLEIWADDVKCSHGCTTGQLDEEAMFYLRSRGISESIAKAMLLYAFAADVLTPIKNEALKSYLDGLIAERLHTHF